MDCLLSSGVCKNLASDRTCNKNLCMYANFARPVGSMICGCALNIAQEEAACDWEIRHREHADAESTFLFHFQHRGLLRVVFSMPSDEAFVCEGPCESARKARSRPRECDTPRVLLTRPGLGWVKPPWNPCVYVRVSLCLLLQPQVVYVRVLMHSATINIARGGKKKPCMLMHLFGFSESLTGCLCLRLGRCTQLYILRQCAGFFSCVELPDVVSLFKFAEKTHLVLHTERSGPCKVSRCGLTEHGEQRGVKWNGKDKEKQKMIEK